MLQVPELALQRTREIFAEHGIQVNPTSVVIGEDCRDELERETNLAGHVGIYLGDFYYPDLHRPHHGEPDESDKLLDFIERPEEWDDDAPIDIGNPAILADNGEIIWGIECFWHSTDKKQESDTILARASAAIAGVPLDDLTFAFSEDAVFERLRRQLEEGSSGNLSETREN